MHVKSIFWYIMALSVTTTHKQGCIYVQSWQRTWTDLLKMAGLDKDITATAKVAAIFLQCQLLISKVGGAK